MAKASMSQLHELGLRLRHGQIPMWKISAVFGIVKADLLGTYLHLVNDARRKLISAGQIQALIEGNDEELGIFRVEVDYSLTLEQMVQTTEASKYGWVHGDIYAEHFPVRGEGKVERDLVLFYLDREASTGNVLVEMDYRGLRPAKIEEILALGALRPELQKEFSIVALGSHWASPSGDRFAQLTWDFDDCVPWLDLGGDCCSWESGCRFLAVRKDAA